MPERSAFHQSQGGDRKYTADRWADIFAAIQTTGYIPGFGAELVVQETSPPTMGVRVMTGSGFVRGRFYEVYTTPVTLPITASHATQYRKDLVVIRDDLSAGVRATFLVVKVGAYAATLGAAVLPTLQNDSTIKEVGLAQVNVAPTDTAIQNAEIVDLRLSHWARASLPDLNVHKASNPIDHVDSSVTDPKIGNRSVDDQVAFHQNFGPDTLKGWLNRFASLIQRIQGTTNFYEAPLNSLGGLHTTKVSKAGDNMTGTLVTPNVFWGNNATRTEVIPNFNVAMPTGWYEGSGPTGAPIAGPNTWYLFNFRHQDTGNVYGFQMAWDFNDPYVMSYIRNIQNGSFQGWYKMWNGLNDGNGSGLDADVLRGMVPGNGSGNIPISNGTLNTNLNAQMINGYQALDSAGHLAIYDGARRVYDSQRVQGYGWVPLVHQFNNTPFSLTTGNQQIINLSTPTGGQYLVSFNVTMASPDSSGADVGQRLQAFVFNAGGQIGPTLEYEVLPFTPSVDQIVNLGFTIPASQAASGPLAAYVKKTGGSGPSQFYWASLAAQWISP